MALQSEPFSYQDTEWISLHRKPIDAPLEKKIVPETLVSRRVLISL